MKLGRIALLLGLTLLLGRQGYAQDPTFDWVVSIGAPTTFSGGYGIAHDDLGNLYVTGRFTGTIDFDPGAGVANLTSAGGQDTYITKVNADGDLVWARRVGGPNDVYSFDVAVDEAGNVYVTGAFSGTADFDPGTGTFNLTSIGLFFDEIFVLKLDTDGNFAWARKMGSSDFDFGRSIAVSAAGNVFTTGSFRGTVDFDPGPGTSSLTSTSGGNDIFISKLDASGNFVWARRMGGSGNDIGYAVTVDDAENVFTTGSFSATADFDPGASVFNLTEVSNGDIFVSKLDGAGNFVWAKGMGGTSSDVGYGVQVDYAGNVYTTGYFHTTVDFDPGSGITNLVSVGFNDAFISKLDANGNYLWAKGMGGTSDEESNGLALDGFGNVYATGGFESTVDFDPGPGTFNLTPVGSGDGFVVKLDEAGDFVWAQAFEGSGRPTPEGIDVDVYGSIYTTGYFSGTVDFDTGLGVHNVTAAGSNDTFIHKMRQASTPPTIISFAPTTGPVGSTVIINGTNFSPTHTNNLVAFNGTTAVVTASTTTSITTSVPIGATTGTITVTVAGNTATSATNFTVTAASLPTITSFTPTSGPISTTVTITGTNFSTTPANNLVAFNGTSAVVTASTATSITTSVPTGATTGTITVTVVGNTATSASNFTVATTTNQPPVIAATTSAAPIEGIVTIDLLPLISDPDDNLDLSTLNLLSSTSEQGAAASVNTATSQLTLDYGTVFFAGTDQVELSVCDFSGECAQQALTIEVGGDIIVYNAISPDGNGLNETFLLQYIDILPDAMNNRVSIFNRWGDLVFEVTDYNNTDRVFKGISKGGKDLPSGTYYYKIEFSGGRKTKTGYLSLKR